jgi:acyl-coenzyme A synthetase/AMP-(fatty) acid ligase
VLAQGVEPSPALARQLQNFVRQRAPQRYPQVLEFVGALPKTASGKVRRFELRAAEAGAVR